MKGWNVLFIFAALVQLPGPSESANLAVRCLLAICPQPPRLSLSVSV